MNEITIVSGTKQEFRGQRYWLCGFYFQRYGKRLHRAVWEAHHGEIPTDCHVHHKVDRDHNEIEDLELLTVFVHTGLHSARPRMTEAQREARQRNQKATAAWHASPEGLAWHREHGRRSWEGRKKTTVACPRCGKIFETSFPTRRPCCSHLCAERLRHGVTREYKPRV